MHELLCPKCGAPLRRVRRRIGDRVLSLFWPLRRYRCQDVLCRWEGNLSVKRTPRAQDASPWN